MVKCSICQKTFKNNNGLGKHIHNNHEINRQDYYDTHISEISKFCKCCGKEKTFRGLGEGYRIYCSVKCRSKDTEPSKYWEGKKQSKDTIKKRIQNTDQLSKEHKRKQTMIEKYGVDNPSMIPEVKETISKKTKGKKRPRSKEHQNKIIQSKKINNSLKHTLTTRQKIINSLNNYYQKGNDQCVTVTSLPSNGRGHKTGYHNGILYRSSYELKFLHFCEKYDILVTSCESKQYRVRYHYENKQRWYYPDFYLPQYDICVEVKPKSMFDEQFYAKKDAACLVYSNYKVVNENHLIEERKLYEHIFY